MQIEQILVESGGIARTADLLRVFSRGRLRAAVASGAVVRLARGTYALPAVEEAKAAAASLDGALSLTSAALAHGWKVKVVPAQPCVVVPRSRNVAFARRAGVTLRRGEVTRAELDARVTDPVRTVLDCARLLPFDEALAVADSALRAGVVRTELLWHCQRLPRTGRSRAFRVVELATRLAANPFESVLRAVVLDLPAEFEPQVWIGSIGRADLVDRRRRIVLEADSFAFHSDAAALDRDITRYNAFVCEGYLVLRFGWKHVMFEHDYVRATVRAALALERRRVRPTRRRRAA